MTRGPEQGFRCSALSRERGEPQEGTASTVRSFVLLECAGPWGTDALRDSRLPLRVKERLRELERETAVRPLLVRRPGGDSSGPTHVFAAHADGGRPWLQRALLDGPADLLDLDLEPLAAGRRPGWAEAEGPLFAVCTHGRHDACCAERGRPVAAALAAVAPEATWEVSHLGGDRFAANVLVLPDGLYYGRVEPEDGARLVAAHADGRLDLEHLRGRTTSPFAVQAAEIHLRRHLGEDRAAAVAVRDRSRAAGVTSVTFEVADRHWTVQVATSRAGPSQLTCRATAENAPPVHELVAITERGAPRTASGPPP